MNIINLQTSQGALFKLAIRGYIYFRFLCVNLHVVFPNVLCCSPSCDSLAKNIVGKSEVNILPSYSTSYIFFSLSCEQCLGNCCHSRFLFVGFSRFILCAYDCNVATVYVHVCICRRLVPSVLQY